MRPIRGPIDYNRYPPRERRPSSDAPPHQPASHQPASHQPAFDEPSPHRRFQSGRGHRNAAQRGDFERRRAESDAGECSPEPAIATGTEEEFPAPAQELRRGRRARSRRGRHPAHREIAAGVSATANGESVTKNRRVRSGRRRVALWKRARRWAYLLLLLLLGEMGVAMLTSSHFAIARVEVHGLNITTPAQVAPVQGALLGRNWLRAPLSGAKAELEKVPSVQRVEMTRMLAWPPQILIRVSERQPFARVGAGRKWFVVDSQGVPFRVATKEDEALYAVTGPTLQPQLGRALPAAAWNRVRQVARALAQSAAEGERWALRRLYFDRHGFASLRLTGGAQDETLVQLGSERWPEKLRRARQALAYFEATGRRASTLNLLSYSMPTWTPKTLSQAPVTTSQIVPKNLQNGAQSKAATRSNDASEAKMPTASQQTLKKPGDSQNPPPRNAKREGDLSTHGAAPETMQAPNRHLDVAPQNATPNVLNSNWPA